MNVEGMVITARGPVEPEALGAVLMHEHLHMDYFDGARDELIVEERPLSAERRRLLEEEALPPLARCTEHGCRGLLDASPPPHRAWPTFYTEASDATGVHIVLCTGCYREVEVGTYYVRKAEDAIWPFAATASVEELEDLFVREIVEGIHGTDVHAGAIKLAASAPELTPIEEKAFRAGARAQRRTGVHVTTHCTAIGGETTQLRLLDEEGVDLSRVIIGHTAWHLTDPACGPVCLDWMRRGACFMPSNLLIGDDAERWRPLVEAVHRVFDAGLGDRLCFGLDWAFASERGTFGACGSAPPFLHMFTHTLPAFRCMGLTQAEERAIMQDNPQRLLPVREPGADW